MNKHPKLGLAATLLVVVGAALAIAQTNRPASSGTGACCLPLANPATISSNAPPGVPTLPPEKKPLPKLLDLGAGKCIPCKMMVPVLDGLRKEYAGQLDVEFIDVWENPDAGKQHGIEVIPTQIFYDVNRKELFRHIGFFSQDDILAKWKELGVDLKGSK